MKRKSTLNGYQLDVNNQKLTVSKNDESLSFALGEGEKLSDLIGVMSKMKGLPVFPPVIRTTPFAAEINDNDISITHTSGGRVSTTWSDLDLFVDAIYSITNIAKDMATLGNDKAQGAVGNFNDHLNH